MTGIAATIVVHRPDGVFIDLLRNYHIVLDGKRVGAVARGRTAQFEVTSPGPHRVRAEIDWTGSPELDFVAEPNEKIYLTVLPRANALTAIFHMWGRTSYLRLEREGDQQERIDPSTAHG